MIKISNLSVDYRLGDRLIRALEDISLNIEENKSYAIIGESGSEKSTLGMSILRLLPQNSITQGNIYYKNNDIFKMNIDELNKIRWIELSVVF